MKIADAKNQADAAKEVAMMTGAPRGDASAVDGTWKVAARGQEGTLTLHGEGDTLTGHISVAGIEADIEDGKLNGSSLTGLVEATGPIGKVNAKLSGTVVGDRLTAVIKVGIVKTKVAGTRA